MTITNQLFALQDLEYKAFHSRLIPNVEPDRIIGVRTPKLRALAKQIYREDYVEEFLDTLPHYYYEENNIHAELLLLRYKDVDELLERLAAFLPYVDNWATCDMIAPKIFKKNQDKVYPILLEWLDSEHTYQQRFAIVALMKYFLDGELREGLLEKIASIRSEEYYIRMAVAWFFSEALAKQYDKTLPFIEGKKLDVWTHNKAIQKARESYRVDAEKKNHINMLKIK